MISRLKKKNKSRKKWHGLPIYEQNITIDFTALSNKCVENALITKQ
jgi:hypothetical protein